MKIRDFNYLLDFHGSNVKLWHGCLSPSHQYFSRTGVVISVCSVDPHLLGVTFHLVRGGVSEEFKKYHLYILIIF